MLCSHDRHLLRSVCDELYIVHRGRVVTFREELDAYPAWLREQSSQSLIAGNQPAKSQSRKELRRIKAAQRNRLEPQRKQVQAYEQRMAQTRLALEQLEMQLAEESLYSDPTRKTELTRLVQQQGALSKKLESLEAEWLDATEMLESIERNSR